MISTGDLTQLAVLLSMLGYTPGGGGGGGVTPRQVQEFAFNYDPATGANDAFVVDLNPAVTVLTDGLIVTMSSGSLQNDTTSPTLQINALTPVPIVLWGNGVVAIGDIETSSSYLFIYNLTSDTFQLINPSISTANAFFVQGNSYNNAIDSGTVNAYNVTLLVPPQGSFGVGFPIYMQVAPAHDNTGASTLTVNGVTDDITLADGSPLPAGALVGNQIAYFLFANGAWVLMNPVIASTGGLLPWIPVSTTTRTMAINNGYISNNASQSTFTLPASAPVGTVCAVEGVGLGGWIVQANAGQTIQGGSEITSSGGTVTSQTGTDNIYLLCIVANTTWKVTETYSQGLTYF